MIKPCAFPLVLLLCTAIPSMAQHPVEEPREPVGHPQAAHSINTPRSNQGQIPEPPRPREPNTKPEPEQRENGKMNSSQHVNQNHWYGHDQPNDPRFHLDHPFEHGHFAHFGPQYRYTVVRVDRDHHRFWLPGGFYFEVASWDWFICTDWCWDCGDDFVIYDDPDHVGWYLIYNVHTGQYAHVLYLGT